jgi:hypothetical protein
VLVTMKRVRKARVKEATASVRSKEKEKRDRI